MILSWIIDWTDLTVDLANEETKFAISFGSNRIMATIEMVDSENILYWKVAMYIARIYPSSMELQQLLSIWLSRKDCDSYWPVAKVSRRLAPYSSGRNISRMAGWARPLVNWPEEPVRASFAFPSEPSSYFLWLAEQRTVSTWTIFKGDLGG